MSGSGDISKSTFQIGAVIVRPDRNLLDKNGEIFSLEPRIMDVLCVLADQPRTVISRPDLIDSVWKVEFGADESLTRAISILRKTFTKAGETDKFIQTIPKRGYRLARDVSIVGETAFDKGSIAPVKSPQLITSELESVPSISKPARTIAARPKAQSKRVTTRILLAIIGMSVIAALLVFLRTQKPFGRTLAVTEYGRSIAVLSFADMSPDGDQEFFSDGLAEELLNALVQISDLRIVGRASSFSYKGKGIDPREIGKALDVSLIIDGSLRKQDDQVRINVHLISVSNGAQIWSKSYDGTLSNTFELQEKISEDIVTELTLLLGINFGPAIDIEP